MEWIKYNKYNLPPQGLKIVCFKKGDLWVARRLNYKGENFFLEIRYGTKSAPIITDTPDYWINIKFLEDYTGYIRVSIDLGPLMTLDEMQISNPEDHEYFVESLLEEATDNRCE